MRTDDAGSGEFRYHDDDWKGYRRRKKEDKEEKEREESDKIFGSNLSDDARAHQQSDYGSLEAFPFFFSFPSDANCDEHGLIETARQEGHTRA